MSRNTVRSLLLLITYTALLVAVLVKLDVILGMIGSGLNSLRPLFVGFGIAFVLDRPCNFFCRQYDKGLRGTKGERMSRPLAVLTSYVVLLVTLTTLFSFVLPKLMESLQIFAASLNDYVANMQVWVNELMEQFDLDVLQILDLSKLNAYLKELIDGVFSATSNAVDKVIHLTGSVVSIFVTLVLAVVFSIYMLSGSERLKSQCRRMLRAYVPQKQADRVSAVVRLTAETFTSFVSGQLIEACILGGLCALGMLFIQSDYAALIGVIVGASALIPVAGAYIGAVLSAFLLLMVSPVQSLVFLIFLGILQQIEGNVIYPRVVGTSIGLPGIWVLAAVTVGGGLFGLVGILLSVPTVSVLYTLLRQDVRRRLEKKSGEGQ